MSTHPVPGDKSYERRNAGCYRTLKIVVCPPKASNWNQHRETCFLFLSTLNILVVWVNGPNTLAENA